MLHGVCPIVSCRGCSRAAHRVTDEQTKDFLIVCPSGHERFFRWIGTFHSSLRSWYPLRGNYSQSNSCGAAFSIFRISLILLRSLWEKFSAMMLNVSFYFSIFRKINDTIVENFQCDLLVRKECKIVQWLLDVVCRFLKIGFISLWNFFLIHLKILLYTANISEPKITEQNLKGDIMSYRNPQQAVNSSLKSATSVITAKYNPHTTRIPYFISK